METVLFSLALPILAYLLGSIPFGLLIVRRLAKADIRHIGSGNIGATNVKRALGNKWAAATLICDFFKGIPPVWVAVLQSPTNYQWLPAITVLAAVCGHIYPVYFKFRPSGKGVATTLGSLIVISPWALMICILIFLSTVFVARRVSVGSLAGTFILPPAIWFTTHDPALCAAAILIMALILYRHGDNIHRLARGVEPTIASR
ncbi:MAG: glycerol-3-phosphate 1-O-acyltransferase PlsY [Desulfobacteraceae bacterium]|jgi:glycerol-3-phosphate acyltransferase PlsY